MLLKECLEGMVQSSENVLLNDGSTAWEAGNLLSELSDRVLSRTVHKTNMYIALVDAGGYMGEVLYRLNPKN